MDIVFEKMIMTLLLALWLWLFCSMYREWWKKTAPTRLLQKPMPGRNANGDMSYGDGECSSSCVSCIWLRWFSDSYSHNERPCGRPGKQCQPAGKSAGHHFE